MRPDFSSRSRQPSSGFGLWLPALGAFAFVGSAWLAWGARTDLRDVRRSIDGLRPAGRATPVGDRDAETEKAVRRFAAAVERPPAETLHALASLLPNDARYTSIGVSYDSSVRVDLGVESKSAAGYDALVKRLTESADIDDIQPGSETREREITGRIRATFRTRP